MKSWWYYFNGILPQFEVQYILDYTKGLPWKEGTIGHGGGGSVVRKATRNSNIKWIPKEPVSQWMFDRVAMCVMRANRDCFNFDLPNEPYLNLENLQFTEYSSKQEQHYDWHIDNNWITPNPNSWDRKLSVVVQLSDPSKYEGGRLELDGLVIPEGNFRNPGDMVIFPSFLKHRVTPVTKGTRHSLVAWVSGPRFK